MDWKFWKKNTSVIEKLSKPKDIPEQIGMHLVAKMGKSPDWVWSLKAVVRIKTEKNDVLEFRIFDPKKSAKIVIKDFYSLDNHPELILFEGSINKKLRKLNIEERQTPVIDSKAA